MSNGYEYAFKLRADDGCICYFQMMRDSDTVAKLEKFTFDDTECYLHYCDTTPTQIHSYQNISFTDRFVLRFNKSFSTDKWFSGQLVCYYDSLKRQKHFILNFKDGNLSGVSKGWFRDGSLRYKIHHRKEKYIIYHPYIDHPYHNYPFHDCIYQIIKYHPLIHRPNDRKVTKAIYFENGNPQSFSKYIQHNFKDNDSNNTYKFYFEWFNAPIPKIRSSYYCHPKSSHALLRAWDIHGHLYSHEQYIRKETISINTGMQKGILYNHKWFCTVYKNNRVRYKVISDGKFNFSKKNKGFINKWFINKIFIF